MKQITLNNSFNKTAINSFILTKNCLGVDLNNLNGKFFNYVLCLDNDIVYIGYSANIYLRLVCHKQYIRNFNKILLIEFDNKKLAMNNEKELIKYFIPKLNRQYLK